MVGIGGNPRYQVIVHRSTDTKSCILMTTSDSHTISMESEKSFEDPFGVVDMDLGWCAKGDGSNPR